MDLARDLFIVYVAFVAPLIMMILWRLSKDER